MAKIEVHRKYITHLLDGSHKGEAVLLKKWMLDFHFAPVNGCRWQAITKHFFYGKKFDEPQEFHSWQNRMKDWVDNKTLNLDAMKIWSIVGCQQKFQDSPASLECKQEVIS